MRGFRVRASQLGRRGATRPSAPTSTTALPVRTQAPASSLSLLQLRASSSSHLTELYSSRSFSVSSKFPTQDESAILAHTDEQHDPNSSQLVCGSCSTPISQTRDLIFFKWYTVPGSLCASCCFVWYETH